MSMLENEQLEGAASALKPSFDQLQAYRNEIEGLLSEYGEILAPRIVEYEAEFCQFPVEVLNEIRAIYAHMFRASVSTGDDIAGNISKARSHSKRAVIDCYKYLCVAYDDRYHEFFKKYGYINWERSKLSDQIKVVEALRKEAVKALRKAKEQESKDEGNKHSAIRSSEKVDDYRVLYKSAYDLYYQLMGSLSSLESQIFDGQIVSRFPTLWMTIVGVVSGALGFILAWILK